MLPEDFPAWQTVYWWFRRFMRRFLFETIHDVVLMIDRERAGREASTSAAVVDSQSVKAPAVPARGYDAGKKTNGRKRHIAVDTLGLLLHAIVHPADIQVRDGGMLVLSTLFGMYPFLQKLFADGGYQGPVFQKALAKALPHLEVEIVKRPDHAKGFEVLPQRWVVERTFAWFNRCRRLAKDFENLTRNALAFLRLASIRLMLRKLCNQ
jgi:transposase